MPYIHKVAFARQSEEGTSSDIRTTPASPSLPTFPKGTQYPPSLPKGLTLQLHPSAKRQSSARPSKPRPLHGFAPPASTPLAKAPLCPVGTVNLLSPVPVPLPSQGVIVLTQSPLIPVTEAVPVTQLNTTPVHGTVALNSVGPGKFQYIVSQQGCVNPIEPPASLSPATVQIPSMVANNGPVSTNGVGKCLRHPQKKVSIPKKQMMPRKLLPNQTTSLNSTQLLSHTPVSVTLCGTPPTVTSANFVGNGSAAPPSLVIIQPSSLLNTPYVHPPLDPQELVKSSTTSLPQHAFTQTVSGLSYPGTLLNNGVRMSSPDTNMVSKVSEFKPKSSPVFYPHPPPSAIHMMEGLKASPGMHGLDNQEQSCPALNGELACDVLVSNQQSKTLPDIVVNTICTANLNCGSLVPTHTSIRVTPPTTSHSAHFDIPVDNSLCVLLQAASQLGTSQSFLMPKTDQISNQPQLQSAKGRSKVAQQKTTVCSTEAFSTSSMPNVRENNLSLQTVGVPLDGYISQTLALPSTDVGDDELWNEDMEAGAKVDGEDMAGALFGNPVLTLSESSCSPHSNLSSISHVDSSLETLENTMEDNTKSGGGSTQDPANSNSSKDQFSRTGEVPGLLTYTSGTENQKPPGSGEGLNQESRGEEGEGHPNEESGGGEERDASDKGEERGNGNGGREGQGNGKGSKNNDDEKDGEREEEEEDFDELTQDEDEEEVMSSASEESVLSVPELQVCSASVTFC